MGLGKALSQSAWQEKLRRALAGSRGIRLGESTVVSRQVHMSDPHQPELVTILTTADAGRTFYGRTHWGEVVHLDIFHEIAEVDHRKVAEALRHVLADVRPIESNGTSRLLLDYFDLQTGVGGGRVTGDLSYGQKPSLKVAHRNHVHIAGHLHESQLHLVLDMVGAVEESILAQGVEIRRLERLAHQRGTGTGEPLDLSAYTDLNDTWLRGNMGGPTTPPPSSGGRAQDQQPQSLRAGRGAGAGPGSGGSSSVPGESTGVSGREAPEADAASDSTDSGQQLESAWDLLEQEQRLQSALELSQRLGSPDEVMRVLDELSRDQGWASLYNSGSSQAPFVIRQLEEEGLVRREIRGLKLTDDGQVLLTYLHQHLRDVKLRFRKLIRRMPAIRPGSRRPGRDRTRAKASPDVRYGPIRGTAQAEQGAWLGDIALPDTLRAGIRRIYLERVASPDVDQRRGGLSLQRQDIHLHLRSGDHPLNICLLIDASASMAGRRILAAKHLARHLLVSTRDRIACIAFQEREVKVYVPFTRDWTQVEEGLARMQPLGLTPLAHGLIQSMELIRASRVRRPLLLLITDGIPTVPKWTIDPLADALEAARQVGLGRIPFGCIGLQPSRRYLEELVRVGGGTLHVVDELNEDALISIAHQERLRTSQRLR